MRSVPGERVRLQVALVVLEEVRRAVACVRRREVEDGIGMRAIADVDPDAALAGRVARLVLHRQHRVVGMYYARLQNQ